MRLVYLESALEDLEWVRVYYERVFREGAWKAAARFAEAEALLLAFPLSGGPMPGHVPTDGLRRRRVSRTPFSLIYRVEDNRIEVVRVEDGRSGPR